MSEPLFQSSEPWLEHAGFLRRMARSLVYDPHQADDAVQEAWVAALSRAREGADVPRSWLAGVVRNVTRKRRREEGRRRAREERVARGEALPPGTDDVARLEVSRRVIDAVAELDEPYRSVVLRRFFDELPPREIAKRHGVPVNTVRSQIQRGVHLLKEKLLEGNDRDDTALLGALLPLAGPPPSPFLPEPTSSLPWIGALVMNNTLKLAALGAAVVIGSTLVWKNVEPAADLVSPPGEPVVAADPRAPLEQPEPTAAAAPTLALDEAAPAGERFVAPDASPDSEPAAWTVRGTASLASRGPYPGARVRMRLYEGYDADEVTLEEIVEADGEGRFEWSLAEPPRGGVWITAGAADPDVRGWGDSELVPTGGEPPQEMGVSIYPLDAAVVGEVVDARGVPVVGARVHTDAAETLTDGEGAYRLSVSSAARSFTVWAEGPGFAQVRQNVTSPAAGREVEVDFELRAGMRVVGVVSDSLGNPVEGATVSTFFTRANEVRTDAQGRFEIEHLDPARGQHSVQVEKEGWPSVSVQVGASLEGLAEVEITYDRGATVTGRVVDETGAPLAGAWVYAGFSPSAWNREDAYSHDDGSFSFAALERGSVTLVAQLDGRAPAQEVVRIPASVARVGPIELVLGPAHFAAGTIVDEDGEPLAGQGVSVTYRGEYIDARTQTDSAGRFRLDGLPGEDLGIEIYGDGFVRHEEPLTELDRDDLTYTLRRAGHIAGRVVDAASGEPIERFNVRLVEPRLEAGEERLHGLSASWLRQGHDFSHPEGLWDTGVGSMEPDKVIGVEVSAAGYATARERHVVVRAEFDPEDLVLRLARGARLIGAVSSPEGGAVEDAEVELLEGDTPIHGLHSEPHGRRIVRTDAAGSFAFEGVAAGQARLRISAVGWPSSIDGPFEVGEAGTVERWIELTEGARVEGRLLDARGDALAGATVRLATLEAWFPGPIRSPEAKTSGDGSFAFEGLSPGLYSLAHALVLGDRTVHLRTRRLRAEAGETTRVELEPAGTARIVGSLRSEDELPERVSVQLHPIEADPNDPTSFDTFGALARDGAFRLEGLPAGSWRLSVFHHDWKAGLRYQGSVEVETVDGETLDAWVPVEAAAVDR